MTMVPVLILEVSYSYTCTSYQPDILPLPYKELQHKRMPVYPSSLCNCCQPMVFVCTLSYLNSEQQTMKQQVPFLKSLVRQGRISNHRSPRLRVDTSTMTPPSPQSNSGMLDSAFGLTRPPKVDGGYVFTPVCLFGCLFVCLFVCLWAGYLKKVMGRLWQKLVDELGRWQEQADSILVQVWILIRPLISGIQNVNCSAWRRCALHRVPFYIRLWFLLKKQIQFNCHPEAVPVGGDVSSSFRGFMSLTLEGGYSKYLLVILWIIIYHVFRYPGKIQNLCSNYHL